MHTLSQAGRVGKPGRTQGYRSEVNHDAQGEPGLVDAGVVPVAVQDAVGDQVKPAYLVQDMPHASNSSATRCC